MKTCCYIERFTTHDALTAEPKTLVSDPTLRRRMSRTVRMGVLTALECLQGASVDAIVTATGFGCLADSEKFLRNLLDQNEELLTPTPFIQSTFNTIGAQIALLCGCRGCNTTFAHRGHSFESALLEASMLLSEGSARRILVGAADERTPSQHRIMDRMGLWRGCEDGEGAAFMLLSGVPSSDSQACITDVDFPEEALDEQQIAARYDADRVVFTSRMLVGCYPTVSAYALVHGVEALGDSVRRVAVYNRYLDNKPSVIVVSACR